MVITATVVLCLGIPVKAWSQAVIASALKPTKASPDQAPAIRAAMAQTADVVTLDEAETVQGERVTITVDGDKMMINESQVIVPEVEGSNGVIHVVDAVLFDRIDCTLLTQAATLSKTGP